MKTLFIPAKSRLKLNTKKLISLTKPLSKNIAIAYSIQFKDIALEIKTILSKTNNITDFIQVLGCSNPRFKKNTESILLIGEGRFHAVSLMRESKIQVHLYSHNTLQKIPNTEVDKLEKRKKGAYMKYLNSDKIGILISTKPGQQRFNQALKFKKNLNSKKSYLFLANDLNMAESENFQLESWVNTACPRMDLNSTSIVNMKDL